MIGSFLLTILAPWAIAAAAELPAASNVRPPALPAADTSAKPPTGLTLAWTAAGRTDLTEARLAALYVSAATSPSPFLPPGPFKATFTGYLNSRIRDSIQLSAVGTGRVTVTLNDQPAVSTLDGKAGPAMKLNKGKNKIVIEYASPEDKSDASLRLLWQSDSFSAEPVPPTVLTHDVTDDAYHNQARVRLGRELFADLRCIRCHTPEGSLPPDGMPELASPAPDLSAAGTRLNAAYLVDWILDPKAHRPSTLMPRLLRGADARQHAADLAAFLAQPTLDANGLSPAIPTDQASIDAGARTFLTLGCIACHTTPYAAKGDPDRLPLNIVAAKWRPGALIKYLQNPEVNYPATRMPNFRLSDAESTNLTAYLLAKSPTAAVPATAGVAAAGQKLFFSVGCASCHTLPIAGSDASAADAPRPAQPLPLAKLLQTDWTRGCMASDNTTRGAAPDFSLTAAQRAAIQAFAGAAPGSLFNDTPRDFAQRKFVSLQCAACHPRDNDSDRWFNLDEIKSLEAALPAPPDDKSEGFSPDQVTRPMLTYLGEKLKPEWSAALIAGQVPYKPRPWLHARMPGFPAYAKTLAIGFASEHGYPPVTPPEPPADAVLASIGQRLSGKTGGFSCIQCHAVGSFAATAVFEAPGINFAHVTDRLHHDYYVRWVRNPLRIDRNTRMPTFTQPDGRTAIKDVLDGDSTKQFDAIWNYLLGREAIKPPAQ